MLRQKPDSRAKMLLRLRGWNLGYIFLTSVFMWSDTFPIFLYSSPVFWYFQPFSIFFVAFAKEMKKTDFIALDFDFFVGNVKLFSPRKSLQIYVYRCKIGDICFSDISKTKGHHLSAMFCLQSNCYIQWKPTILLYDSMAIWLKRWGTKTHILIFLFEMIQTEEPNWVI